MNYTFTEALAEATRKADLAGLLDVLRNTAATVEGAPSNATSLLYGGDVYGQESFKASEALVKSTAGESGAARLVRIDESSAGKLLFSRDFQSLVRTAIDKELKATTAGFEQLTADAQKALIEERFAKDFFGKDASGNRLVVDPLKPSMWDIASGNWVEQAKGNFRLVIGKVSETSILLQTELPKLIAKVGNFFVDGVDINHFKTQGAVGGVNAMLADGFQQTHATLVDLSPENLRKFSALTPETIFEVMDTSRYSGFLDVLITINKDYPLLSTRLVAGMAAIEAGAKSLADSGLAKGLNKLGFGAALFGLSFAVAAATEESSHGNSDKAWDIIKEFAAEFAGGILGGIAGEAIAAFVVGLAVAAGAVISAPVIATTLVVGMLVGGFYGATGAKELYSLLSDRDNNGKRDVIDKLTNLFFGETSTIATALPADLNGEKFTIAASLSRDEMVSLAKGTGPEGIAWRYALRELNSFVITDVSYDRHNTDGSLDLYNKDTNPAGLTNEYLADRAAMLAWKLQFDKANARDEDDAPIRGGRTSKPYNEEWDTSTIEGNWDFIDLGTKLPGGAPLKLAIDGKGISLSDHQVVFGSKAADNIEGSGDTDRLYGMAGNDTLDGKGGADYMEGGAGDDKLDGGADNDTLLGGTGRDTYTFTGSFGHDTVLDSDGLGTIILDGMALTQGKYLAEGLWESEDKSLVYVRRKVQQIDGSSLTDLVIGQRSAAGAATVNSTLTIKNWRPGDMGLSLPSDEKITTIPTNQFDVSTDESREEFYSFLNRMRVGDLSPSVSISNAAIGVEVLFDSGARMAGAGVTSKNGDDFITGGETLALLNTYLGGGGGDDTIFATTAEKLSDAIVRGDRNNPNTQNTSNYVLDGGSGDDTIIGSVENDVIFGGDGNDTIVGGAGNDVIISEADGDSYRNALTLIDATVARLLIGQSANVEFGNSLTFSFQVDGLRIDDGYNNLGELYTIVHTAPISYDPLNTIDFTDLEKFNNTTDIRGLGFVLQDGTELTLDQMKGSITNYFQSGFSTNRYVGNDVIYAGAGDDVVNSGGGDDIIFSGDGNDNVAGYEGDDYIVGGAGNDLLLGDMYEENISTHTNETITIDFYSTKLKIVHFLNSALHGEDYIDGGDGNDLIEGGGKADLLYGGAGNDVIFGDDGLALIEGANAGDDYLEGGVGADMLVGGAGDDFIDGGDDADILIGDWLQDDNAGDSKDILEGGIGNDLLYGGAGDDDLYGDDGDDVLRGDATASASSDKLEINDASPLYSANAGNDFIDGGNGSDELFGNDGDDILLGGAGKDYLAGGNGNDVLTGGSDQDYLAGGAGDDTYIFVGGDSSIQNERDTIEDAQGRNTLQLDGVTFVDIGISILANAQDTLAISVGLVSNGDGTASGRDVILLKDVLRNHTISTLKVDGQSVDFDRFIGQNLQSVIHSTATADGQQLLGGAKADLLVSSQSSGSITGGGGDDVITLDGNENIVKFGRGDGHDVIKNSNELNSEIAQLQQNNAIEFASDISYTDIEVVTNIDGAINIRLIGEDTGLSILGGNINELRFKSNESTVLLFYLVQTHIANQSTDEIDLITGSWLSDTIGGGAGNDYLQGHAGHDRIDGGDGDDILSGDSGNDTLVGGDGKNQLMGGSGHDLLISTGEDYLDGGEGNDAYQISLINFNETSKFFSSASYLADQVGSSTLKFSEGPTDFAQYSVFQSSGSIYLAVGNLGLLELQHGIDFSTLYVAGMADQSITVAELIRRDNADGLINAGSWTKLSGVQTDVSQFLPLIVSGTAANDVLIGSVGNDQLFGLNGNDFLKGGTGSDFLSGGAGSNTYTFNVGDGIDVIDSTSLEASVILFNNRISNDLGAFFNGSDLVITANTDKITLLNYSVKSENFDDWNIQTDDRIFKLNELIANSLPETSTKLETRKSSFIDAQLNQLRTREELTPDYRQLSKPNQVNKVNLQVLEGSTLSLPSYLSWQSQTQSVTRVVQSPIYSERRLSYEYIALENIGNRFLPPEARSVMGRITHSSFDLSKNDYGVIGYYLPSNDSFEPKIIGSTATNVVETVFTHSGAAYQYLVNGTDFDDIATFGHYEESFRGVIETGLGNDFINGGGTSRDDIQSNRSQLYLGGGRAQGLGVWIDGGKGNDQIAGSNGGDILIGGAGSNIIEGWGGADTYIVGYDNDNYYNIKDSAFAEGFELEVYGGIPNIDTIEFDNTVSRNSITYRWTVDENLTNTKTLNFYQQGNLFLSTDYLVEENYAKGIGVEEFKFTDGAVFTRDSLLNTLSIAPNSDPYGGDPYGGDPYGDNPYGSGSPDIFVFDGNVSLSSLSYEWTSIVGGDVATLVIFQDGLRAIDIDYQLNVADVDRVDSLSGISSFKITGGRILSLQELLFSIPREYYITSDISPTKVGSNSNDGLYGNAGTDIFYGGNGEDSAFGNGGEDYLNGGGQNDYLNGGIGSDTLVGGDGADSLFGDAGDDLLLGGAGNDILYGGTGHDTYMFSRGDGIDQIVLKLSYYGQDDSLSDTLIFGSGITKDNVLVSRVNNDLLLRIAETDDRVAVGMYFDHPLESEHASLLISFNDGPVWTSLEVNAVLSSFIGDENDNSIQGTDDWDYIVGWDGSDTLYGLAGNDALEGTSGNDVLIGGDGADNLNGGGDNDFLYGGNDDDELLGADGNDTLFGSAGNDTLDGGSGDNVLSGGAGNDIYLFNGGSDKITIYNFDEFAVEGDVDILRFDNNIYVESILTTQSFNDLILTFPDWSGQTATVLNYFEQDGTSSHTLTGIEFHDGTRWTYADVKRAIQEGIKSPAENQILIGDASDNQISGLFGADQLYGLGGNDILHGGAGQDRLEGGAGDDYLSAGSGFDNYVFGRGDGHDTINNYDNNPARYFGEDTLQFSEGVDVEQLWFRHIGNDLEISIIGTEDRVMVVDWYNGDSHQLGYLSLQDGRTSGAASVQALVEAMAAFAPPAPGQTTLSGSYLDVLQPTIASNWASPANN